ncbi:MAG: heavy-metal-associated domain-containing protein [Micrococcales bacterium]|nr:heavy-metal-associated domain-containing protein [Micrococcales bacterium]MCL2668531.1 heavy-metal-associated domain-containing protein [Micrococcales bacterium]
MQTTFSVDGMTCGHCVRHVTAELMAIAEVSDVQVELNTGGSSLVVVTSDTAVDPDAVAAAVDEAGYQLTPPGSLL